MFEDLPRIRQFAGALHAKGDAWSGHVFGWPAEYNAERPEPPLDSKMTFIPADFCIGESGIWFFSLMWEHGKDAEPVEFLDDRNVVRVLAEPRASHDVLESSDDEAPDIGRRWTNMALVIEGSLEERARRGSKEKFLAAMAKVAEVEPPDERDRWISEEAYRLTAVLAEPKVPYEMQESESQADSDREEMQ